MKRRYSQVECNLEFQSLWGEGRTECTVVSLETTLEASIRLLGVTGELNIGFQDSTSEAETHSG